MQFKKRLGKFMSDRIGSGYWEKLGHALALTPEVRWSICTFLGPAPWSCCGQHHLNQESDLVQECLFSQQVKSSLMRYCHSHGLPCTYYPDVSFPASCDQM